MPGFVIYFLAGVPVSLFFFSRKNSAGEYRFDWREQICMNIFGPAMWPAWVYIYIEYRIKRAIEK